MVERYAGPGFDDCDIGLFCAYAHPTEGTGGVCAEICPRSEGDPAPCTGPGTICQGLAGNDLPLCVTPCDPLSPTCAAPAEACVLCGDSFCCLQDASDHPDVVGDEPGARGESCIPGLVEPDGSDCDPGLHCARWQVLLSCPTRSCCTPYCDLTAADPDAPCTAWDPAERCLSFYEYYPYLAPGHEGVGFCGIPAPTDTDTM
jgi:hypothetical protein